jgi:hypothetical protein
MSRDAAQDPLGAVNVQAFERVILLLLEAECESSMPKGNVFTLIARQDDILKWGENMARL